MNARYYYAIIPYKSCYDNFPGQEEGQDSEEEGFQEDMALWLAEIKEKMKQGTVRIIEAPELQNLMEVLPNQQGQEYQEDIRGPRLVGSYHIRRQGEEVPDGIQPIRMFEIGPVQYRLEEEVLTEQEEIARRSAATAINFIIYSSSHLSLIIIGQGSNPRHKIINIRSLLPINWPKTDSERTVTYNECRAYVVLLVCVY